MGKKIIVAMPVYNHKDTVREAIRTILSQTETDYELVVCDDASTDGTKEELEKLSGELNFKLIVNECNMGTGRTVNKIFDNHGGDSEYLTWISSDNVYETRFLQAHKECLDTGADFSFSNWSAIGGRISNFKYTSCDRGTLIKGVGPSFMFNKHVWYLCGPYVSTPGEDLTFTLKAMINNCKFSHVNETLMKYRRHGNSVSGRIDSGEITKLSVEVCDHLIGVINNPVLDDIEPTIQPEPAPEPTPEPAPEPTPEPAPEPTPEPVQAPESAPRRRNPPTRRTGTFPATPPEPRDIPPEPRDIRPAK